PSCRPTAAATATSWRTAAPRSPSPSTPSTWATRCTSWSRRAPSASRWRCGRLPSRSLSPAASGWLALLVLLAAGAASAYDLHRVEADTLVVGGGGAGGQQ